MKQNSETKNEQRGKPVFAFSLDRAVIEKLDDYRKTIPRSIFVNYILNDFFEEKI